MSMASSSGPVRVRFAPSPTGHLHIGGLRAALFNLLFARHHKGTFLIRIEDTDVERSKPVYVDSIISSLEWVGIDSDEPLVFQMQRFQEYHAVIQKLLDEGKVYRCFCSSHDVEERQGPDGQEFAKYDGLCSTRTPQEDDLKKSFVIRFRIPDVQEITFNDLIRGTITIARDQLDDFIIARSDGQPMYNFVVVVDDAQMKISHVIRGEEHIPNTPKQILLYQACGYDLPQFAHLPLILGPSGHKLSKRDAATSVLEYRRDGYLAPAVLNYLARLGWSHGDQEVFTMQEMIDYFSLDQVGKKGSIFDQKKLEWLNSVYLKNMADEDILNVIIKDVCPSVVEDLHDWLHPQLIAAIALYKGRVKTVRELVDQLLLVHNGPANLYDAESVTTWLTPTAQAHLPHLQKTLEDVSDFSVETVSEALKKLCAQLDVKIVVLAQPIRIALTGSSSSPGVYELLTLVGKERSIERLNQLRKFLER